MIRVALILLAGSAAAVLKPHGAAAESYRPWCLQGIETCIFSSWEQCMMTARGGQGNYCVQNPWYLQYGSGQPVTETTGARPRRR